MLLQVAVQLMAARLPSKHSRSAVFCVCGAAGTPPIRGTKRLISSTFR
jgi:hypothetical protein